MVRLVRGRRLGLGMTEGCRCPVGVWCGVPGSNQRPSACKADATAELTPGGTRSGGRPPAARSAIAEQQDRHNQRHDRTDDDRDIELSAVEYLPNKTFVPGRKQTIPAMAKITSPNPKTRKAATRIELTFVLNCDPRVRGRCAGA